MGWGRSFKKAWSKTMGRGPLSIIGMGKGGIAGYGNGSGMDKAMREVGHGVGYITGANAAEDLAEAQAAANAAAARQATIAAGNQQQVTQAGTEEALSKILKKKSALAKASPTLGQVRGNTTLG